MILLCNTFITETKPPIGKGFVFRENLNSYSNFDIFKYSLSSLAVAYKWKKVLLYIELDQIYLDRKAELERHIREEFKDFELDLRWERNYYQEDWKKTYELLDDNLIWFYCNHDHIFVDSDNEYLSSLVDKMRNEELCSLQFSHWPENIRTASQGGAAPPRDASTFVMEDDHAYIMSENFDSIQIITKELYRRWWFEGEFNHIKLPRPDYFGIGLAEIKPMPIHKLIIPYREICRHFDGYQHCFPPINNYQCPAIDIPEGFFEREMKIRYGFTDRQEGYTNINPVAQYYYAYDKKGTDYKYTLEDLPLVWKNRINSIETNPGLLEGNAVQGRLQSVAVMVYTDTSFDIPSDMIQSIYNLYLQPFSNFTLDV
jgi:hypothetical protein